MPAPRPVTVFGKTYPSMTAACAAFGYTSAAINHRRKAGMSLEQALLASNRYTGAKAHPSYICWNSMIGRCYRPKSGRYAAYGAKGIGVCDPQTQQGLVCRGRSHGFLLSSQAESRSRSSSHRAKAQRPESQA